MKTFVLLSMHYSHDSHLGINPVSIVQLWNGICAHELSLPLPPGSSQPTSFLGPGLGLSPIPTRLEVGTHKIGEFPSSRPTCRDPCDPSCKMSDSPSQPQELDIDEVARLRRYSNPFVFSDLSNRN